MKFLRSPRCLVLTLLLGLSPLTAGSPVGRVIRCQGKLKDTGLTANGTYEFRFSLHDAPTSGTQIGPTRTNAPVAVTGGEFTTSIDFGPGAFNGEGRWLEKLVQAHLGTISNGGGR
jgi:hypothetical protein